MNRRAGLIVGLIGLVGLAVVGTVLLIGNATGRDDRVESAGDLASRMRCKSFAPGRLAEQSVAQIDESGTCELSGETVEVWYFNSPDDRDEVRDQLKDVAAIGMLEPAHMLLGENWAVVTSDGEALDALKELQGDLGGDLID